MYYNKDQYQRDYNNSQMGSDRTKILSRMETLRKKIRSLEESMQRERTLIDYHMQVAASQHSLNWPSQELYAKRSFQAAATPHNQQPFKTAYENYLDDVMRMCHLEEARLQKSMFDLRKVRRYWRNIDFDNKDSDEEEYSNTKCYSLRNRCANSSMRYSSSYAGDY